MPSFATGPEASRCNTACGSCSSNCTDRAACDIEDLDKSELLELIKAKNEELKGTKNALRVVQAQVKKLSSNTDAIRSEKPLRSADWFGRKDDPDMTALYVERYLNYGYTREELCSGKPIIGIAQSGSDLAPCNRHHIELAKRVREGIRTAGAIAFEFPTHPIQETGRRPTASLDRNLAAMALAEVLSGYPLDGVVLLTGCDKTTPAFLMAAAQVNIPAICLNVGPMLNGWSRGARIGSGTVVWKARELHTAGDIDDDQFVDMVADGTPSPGHCNTMGTALTMNTLTEALGMSLPGSAAIPAPYRQRSHAAYETGVGIVEMVRQDIRPRDIMTRQAFENAIVVNSAIGGSTNAPIHLIAVAAHLGVALDLDDWDTLGYHVPLIVNMQPAGEMLSEDYYHAGGLPAVLADLIEAGKLPHPAAMTVNGKSIGQNAAGKTTWDRRTIKPLSNPLKTDAGFLHLRGNLFNSAIMKMSVVSPEFRKDFFQNPTDPNAFECQVAVFDGPEDYKERLETADVDKRTILIMRGVGPLGYPGAAEVVNMHPPSRLLKQGVRALPCIGDGRQSGTSGSPSILNASPEAAAGGNLALVRDRDMVRVDLNQRRVDLLVSEEELSARRVELAAQGGYHGPPSQTYWQDVHRREVTGLDEGMVMKRSVQFQNIAENCPMPRDNH
ncbi:dehydratase [Seiridium cupressi]